MKPQNAPKAEYWESLRPRCATMMKMYEVIAVTIRPAPTAKVPSGTAVRARSMILPERSFTDVLRIPSSTRRWNSFDALTPQCRSELSGAKA